MPVLRRYAALPKGLRVILWISLVLTVPSAIWHFQFSEDDIFMTYEGTLVSSVFVIGFSAFSFIIAEMLCPEME